MHRSSYPGAGVGTDALTDAAPGRVLLYPRRPDGATDIWSERGTARPRTARLGVTGPSDEDGSAPTLRQLIRSRMSERGWSYADLERESGRALSRGRWQQLGSADAQHKFPNPESLAIIARVLEIDVTSVVLAAARAVGLPVTAQAGEFANLLPAGTEQLSEPMRDAILALVRAAVAGTTADRAGQTGAGVTLEWPKASAPSRREPEGPAGYEEADM